MVFENTGSIRTTSAVLTAIASHSSEATACRLDALAALVEIETRTANRADIDVNFQRQSSVPGSIGSGSAAPEGPRLLDAPCLHGGCA